MYKLNSSYQAFFFSLFLLLIWSGPLKTQKMDELTLEKIYTQTDRPFYFPGETIWFKSYVVKRAHTISTLSEIMYADLISPQGSVVKTIKLKIEQGYAYGDFKISSAWVGGIYKLRTYTNWMRNYGEKAFFSKEITVQKVVKPKVLLALKFEKEAYGPASTVIANFTAEDLKNQAIPNTEISYEVSIKGQLLASQKTITDPFGKAQLKFQLPKDLNTRDLTLNVLLPHNGTTESISRSVPIVLDNIDFQFFPESGKLLAGTQNRLAFKVIDEFGKPVDVEGDIVDTSGKIVQSFTSFHDGMGSFELNPLPKEQYFAQLKAPFTSDRNIPLPNPQHQGVNFRLTTDSLSTKIDIHSTLNKTLYLEVFNANQTLIKKAIAPDQTSLDLDTRAFPIGITTFRISDRNQFPLAERLAFLNAHRQLYIDIQMDKSIYQTREQVKLKLTTKDKNKQPIPANLSITVADNKLLSYADDKQDHILSYLLLSSELKGKIHKPDFYFNPVEKKSKAALDYVMLTHAWRDYLSYSATVQEAVFKPEQFAIKYGQITDLKGNPVKANLLVFEQNGNQVVTFESDDQGFFSFEMDDRKPAFLVAYRDDGQRLKIEGKTMQNSGLISKQAATAPKKAAISFKKDNPTQRKIEKKATASLVLTSSAETFEEVVITGFGFSEKKNLTASVTEINVEPIQDIGSVAGLLAGRVAGIEIEGGNPTYANAQSIGIRGSSSISGINQALIVVDGVPYADSHLSNLNANTINSVTVLKNAAATMLYGSAASNGVLLITTKNQNFNRWGWKRRSFERKKYKNYSIEVYYNHRRTQLYQAKQFYIPKYNSQSISEVRNDLRQTIYWNPVVQTDENGEATLEFYNSDAITSFQITAEGIGYNGLVGRKQKAYATKKLLNVDVKIPNYMVLNDTIVLPVTVRNDAEQDIIAKLTIQLPEQLKLLGTFEPEVRIAADSFVVQNIKVIPVKKSEQVQIGLAVQTPEGADLVKKESVILSPYFPTEISMSGVDSKSFQFSIDNLVEGSLKAEFNIYTDVIGEVMDGIEGLLKQPYGCFEQTSSATYPNVMVLKYLRETNKVNQAVEARAMDYIERGYQRLVGFETSKGGFEWFGNTPPHETLTAFGILEFTEMKTVYSKVDQAMIDRTVKWLLSRRDGKGGFKKSEKGYDSFASSPKKVANAYIIYALSEAGVPVDLEKEYNHSFQEALKSKDTYRMALMACASFNLGKLENAAVLVEQIKQNIQAYQFEALPVENTITRSYGEAKKIETLAFALLALLKENNPDEVLIAQGIEVLVGMRKNNRFGSTQSTCMALKALIEFTKYEKNKIIEKGDAIVLTLNGKKIKGELSKARNGKLVIPNLQTYLSPGVQNIAIQYSNAKSKFPYTFNLSYDSFLPDSSEESPLELSTRINKEDFQVGDNVSLQIEVQNKLEEKLGMVTATIGIPSGTTPQAWQLRQLLEEKAFAYYEIFDNYLVFYWRTFQALEMKSIRLDLKADLAGIYQAPASTAYLYYGDEYKTWIAGTKLLIKE